VLEWYGLSEVEFVEVAMDERYVGPARAIADPGLWQQLTALQAIPSRRKGVGTTGIESLLEFSFKYLPVGNAYAEYLVKLVRNSTSESRVYFETMLLELRARTSLNAWSVGCDDFKLISSMLGHSKPLRRAVRAAIYDSFHLADAMHTGEEPKFMAQCILQDRKRNGSLQYQVHMQVHWKGFRDTTDMTWEDEEDLKGCGALVKDFLRSKIKKKKK
jgi:hypothetical protein